MKEFQNKIQFNKFAISQYVLYNLCFPVLLFRCTMFQPFKSRDEEDKMSIIITLALRLYFGNNLPPNLTIFFFKSKVVCWCLLVNLTSSFCSNKRNLYNIYNQYISPLAVEAVHLANLLCQVEQQCTTILYCNSVLQQCTAICNSALQQCTAIVHCNSTLQQCTTIVQCYLESVTKLAGETSLITDPPPTSSTNLYFFVTHEL